MKRVSLILALAVAAGFSTQAASAQTLKTVKDRGTLSCGVGQGLPGIGGLGACKAQRYLATDLDRLSNRLFDADGSLRRVVGGIQRRGTARVQPVQHCGI
jgi:hypothetical protein